MDYQTKQYLRQSAKDNKLLLQNQRKPSTNFVRISLPPSGYLSSINNKLLNYSKTDNELLLQNQNIGVVSNPSEIPLKVTEADQELLRTYVDNLPQNYEYQSEDGTTKFSKYNYRGEPPDLEQVNPEYEQDLQSLAEIEKERDNKLAKLKDDYDNVIEKFKKNVISQKELSTDYKQGRIKDADYEKFSIGLEDKNAQLQRQEQNLIDSMNTISSESDIKNKEADAIKKDISDVKSRNLQKANAYQEELNVFNKGAVSTSKEPSESTQEYVNRLQETIQQPIPENELSNARQYVSKLFKDRMKDIIKPDVVIEQVANTIDPASSDSVSNKQRLLNNWAYIKTKFLNTYGFNPPNMSAQEILDFFDFISSSNIESINIERIASSSDKPQATVTGVMASNIKNVSFRPDVSNSQYLAYVADEPKIAFVIGRNPKDPSKDSLFYQVIGGRQGYYQWKNATSERISAKEHICTVLGITTSELDKKFAQGEKNIIEKLNKDGINSLDINVNPMTPVKRVFLESPTKAEAILLGKRKAEFPQSSRIEEEDVFQDTGGNGLGVNADDFPKFVRFGSVLLELRKLHHHNQLVIKDHRKCAIYGFPTVKVSDTFSNIIINMVHKSSPSFSDLSRLNSHEKELYDVLIALSGLKKKIYNTHDSTISILKKRLNLLESEIEIGNNNPKIYEEIRKILFKLHHLKVISMKQVQSHLKQIG
jgi:hypothetical protein